MLMLTKARGYVDPDDSLLGYFMMLGFLSWLLGLSALYARYTPTSGRLGQTSLRISFAGVVLLAVGHVFSFMSFVIGTDLFLAVLLGAVALATGALLFGVAALRSEILPRYWTFLPLCTGLAGFAWLFLSGAGDVPLHFFVPRTLFALGWLLLGFVLLLDKRGMPERTVLASREVEM